MKTEGWMVSDTEVETFQYLSTGGRDEIPGRAIKERESLVV